MTNNIVIYDACVLFSPPMRDLLLYLAAAGICEGRWSEKIHEEWILGVLRKRPNVSRAQLERTRYEMDKNLPYGLVSGFDKMIDGLHLPDPNDRHVLAAAIHANASLIVTLNLGDFPPSALSQYQIEAVPPDEFIYRLTTTNPLGVIEVAHTHRSNLCRPPKTVDEYLATLEKQNLPKTVNFLREHRNEI